MTCFARPVLIEDMYTIAKQELSVTCYMCDTYTLEERPSIFVRDKPIFSPENILHKDYERKDSVENKITSRES
jgi:hypothetical protein